MGHRAREEERTVNAYERARGDDPGFVPPEVRG
jgi:hypothetical protein